jgi:hypothetical protein
MVLPILLIMTVAVVQFGLLFANLEQGALAARVGAHEASESPALAATVDGDEVPQDIRDAVTHQLCSSGIEWCHIRLEHNVGGTAIELDSDRGDGCECGPDDTLDNPPHDDEAYVRITVCIPLTELMPDSLSYFGYSVAGSGKIVEFRQVRRVEP